MGSKARHAKHILPIILKDRQKDQWYVEPFVGGANVIDKVDGNRIGADFNEYVATMWDEVSRGWVPPEFVSEDEYTSLSSKKKVDPKTAYVGFSMSFGGKFFGGYRRDRAGSKGCEENMSTQSRRSYESMMKQAPNLKGVKFVHSSYDDLSIPDNSIIYCDPPYANTTGYVTGGFDHEKFWQWCDDKIDEGHQVFVSEYNAPDHWICVWQKEVNNTLAKDTGSKRGIEKLFTRERMNEAASSKKAA